MESSDLTQGPYYKGVNVATDEAVFIRSKLWGPRGQAMVSFRANFLLFLS